MDNYTQRENLVVFALRRRQQNTVLVIAGLLFFWVVGLSASVTAQTHSKLAKPSPAPYSPKIITPPPIQVPVKQKSILESLLSLLQRKPFLGGSRNSGGFCGITPAVLGESNVIWSDRPLFRWQGQVQALELRPYKFDVAYEKQPILWNFSPTDQWARYPNSPLQAGQRYEWQVAYLSQQTNEPSRWQQIFQVMEKPERDRIGEDLNALDRQLKTQKVSAEEIALARANFFAAKDLWSDAIQQIDEVGHSFAAGDEFLRAATERVCKAKQLS